MSKIEIHKNSITNVHTDIIVNAANSSLIQGGGVCGDIFKAAGQGLTDECNAIGGCPEGSAVITSSYNLKSNGNKYIIHAVGPMYTDGNPSEEKKLYDCYQNSLNLMKKYGCHSITFPLISSGIFGYPKDQAWKIALQSCKDFINSNPDYKMTIVFVGREREVLDLGKSIMAELESKPANIEKTAVSVSDTDSIKSESEDKKTEYVFFWKHYEDNGFLSNWYESSFTVEGISYWCVEQYMMSKKALMFGDMPVYAKIMQSHDQKEVKNLGKQVHNYDSYQWKCWREIIMFNACYAKFTQNLDLKTMLVGTFGKALAEASPTDMNWGIGMNAKAAETIPSEKWPGENLLGKTLVSVRTKIMSEYLDFAIDALNTLTSTESRIDWCENYGEYDMDTEESVFLDTLLYSVQQRTYTEGFVNPEYPLTTNLLPEKELVYLNSEWLKTLTDNQLLMVFSYHIRMDHFSDGYLFTNFIPSGKMKEILLEIKQRLS